MTQEFKATLELWLIIVEVALLVWIVVQGEYIKFYEKGAYLFLKKRELERSEWREQKRKQIIKKAEAVAAPVEPKEQKDANVTS